MELDDLVHAFLAELTAEIPCATAGALATGPAGALIELSLRAGVAPEGSSGAQVVPVFTIFQTGLADQALVRAAARFVAANPGGRAPAGDDFLQVVPGGAVVGAVRAGVRGVRVESTSAAADRPVEVALDELARAGARGCEAMTLARVHLRMDLDTCPWPGLRALRLVHGSADWPAVAAALPGLHALTVHGRVSRALLAAASAHPRLAELDLTDEAAEVARADIDAAWATRRLRRFAYAAPRDGGAYQVDVFRDGAWTVECWR